MPRILISYRREDSAAYAGRLADRLREHFGRDNVFVDIDTIRPGEDFVEVIDRSLNSCTVVVALIGRGWLDAQDSTGRRRLDGSTDYVRTEIAKALERRVRVIPTLVGDASMPEAKDLPDDLLALTRRQAIEISDSRFHQDVDRLIEALSDTPPVDTNGAKSGRAAPAVATGSAFRWSWIMGTVVALVLVLAGVAGYWRLNLKPSASEASNAPANVSNAPNSPPSAPGTTPSTNGAATAGAAPGAPPARSSSPTLKSNNGQPVNEVEPNDDILHPNLLELGTTVRAEIRPVTDKDFFRVRTPAGKRNEIRVVIHNRSKLMPEVEIWDGKFNSVTSKYNVYGDLYLNFDAEPATDYFVECRFIIVNRNFADPNDSGGYDLTVISAVQ